MNFGHELETVINAVTAEYAVAAEQGVTMSIARVTVEWRNWDGQTMQQEIVISSPASALPTDTNDDFYARYPGKIGADF